MTLPELPMTVLVGQVAEMGNMMELLAVGGWARCRDTFEKGRVAGAH
jgi:hypothetical protein